MGGDVLPSGRPPMYNDRELIVSQKFRRVAEELKLNIDYVPVRLDTAELAFPSFFYDCRGPGAGW